MCASGVGLAELSGIFLLETPEWNAQNLVLGFGNVPENVGGRSVMACDWLDNDRIAFVVMKTGVQPFAGELWVYDRSSGDSRAVATLPDVSGCCGGLIATVPGADYAVTQSFVSDGNNFSWSQPALVNIATGGITHVLEPGDIVVDAFVS